MSKTFRDNRMPRKYEIGQKVIITEDKSIKVPNGATTINSSYNDKEMICPVCKTVFIWSSKQQAGYAHKTKTTASTRKYDRQPPCCCKSCAGKYAAMIQFGHN